MRQSHFAFVVFLVVLVLALAALAYVLIMSTTPARPQSYVFEACFSSLAYPVAMAFASDGRIFYAERLTGNIRIIENGSVLPTPFFTFSNLNAAGERGLLGLALAPGFPQDPWIYAYYSSFNPANNTYENRVVRVRTAGDNGTAMQVLLSGIPSGTLHNGGVIAFGSDGELYALIGDGDIPEAAQSLSALNGKVIRMKPDGSVPPDNPFVNVAGADSYVYTYGHRNMFGIAFHPVTHVAYITENGPSDSDEINLLVPGGNYGWPVVRGIAHTPPYIDPILAYSSVIVPTNAVFYTGSAYPTLHGDFLFGDWKYHRLHDLKLAPPNYGTVTNDSILATAPDGILDVDQSPDGFVWVSTASALYRLVPVSSPSAGTVLLSGFLSGLALAASPRNLSKGHDVPARNAGVPHPGRGPPQGVPRSGVRNPA